MKKFSSLLCLVAMSLLILSLSGCGGHKNSSDIPPVEPTSHEVIQVAVLTSPAFELHKHYRIFTGATLSGMEYEQFYVANIGDETSRTTLNLGLSEELDPNTSLAIVNSSTGAVVFAYNPSGNPGAWKIGGNVKISGGKLMRYRSLTLDEEDEEEEDEDEEQREETADTTDDEQIYYDADILTAKTETERGATSIYVGSGREVSFIVPDTDARPRSVKVSGDVFLLERKVNTFSEIDF